MLVGKVDVDIRELEYRAKDLGEFLKYCDSLVPPEFRHIFAIRDNQRYIACLLFRASKTIPWETKRSIIDTIMSDITITGYTDVLIEVGTLIGLTKKENLNKYRRWEMVGK